MAKLTLSEAARACGVARTTIQRAVKTGRLSLDAEHQVDTAELLRAGYQVDAAVLHAASQPPIPLAPQNAAPLYSTPQRSDAASPEFQFLRQERDLLQQERDRLVQQVDVLLALHQTTQQQLTQAQQMLHEMQHRYDRFLEAPRPVPTPAPPGARVSSPPPPGHDPAVAYARILALQAQGFRLAQIAARLNTEGIPTQRGQPWTKGSVGWVVRHARR
jgi:hypothetical protein